MSKEKVISQQLSRKITIGNKESDRDLIKRILEYQTAKNYVSAADAVRALCEDALDFKKAMR